MQYLIYLTICLIPFYFFRFSFEAGGILVKTSIFEALVAFLFVSSVTLSGSKIKEIFARQHRFEVLIIVLFILSAIIGVIVSPENLKALGILKGWFIIPLMLVWTIRVNFNKDNIYKIGYPIFISVLIVSGWAILQKIGMITTAFYQNGDMVFIEYLRQGRVFGPFESPNYLPMFLIPMTFLSIPAGEKIKNRIVKALYYFFYLLPVTAVFLSGSRAGIITSVVCLLLFLNYRFLNILKARHRTPFKWHVFGLGWLVANLISISFVIKYLADNIGSDGIRAEIYNYSVYDLLSEHWLLGLGLGNFLSAIAQISLDNPSFQQFGLSYSLHPHNLLLAIWLNLGLIGLLSFIFIVIKIFQNAFSTDHVFRGPIVAALFAVIIQGIFDTTYFKNDLSAIFWLIFIIAGIIAVPKYAKFTQHGD